MTNLQSLQSIYSDLYKDVHGFRPRNSSAAIWNNEESLLASIKRLEAELVIVMAEEELAQKAAVVKFEERIEATIKLGAKNRETAIKWIHEAENTDGDDEYLCFCVGIPYGYFKQAA